MKNVLYTLLGVIAGFILAGALLYVSRAPSGSAITLQPAPTQEPLAVHVVGGVARPGIYYLPEGARMQDALDAAGGLLTTAETTNLNLAQRVEDGQKIVIPCKDDSCPVDATALDLPSGEAESTPSGGEVINPAELIDVNIATLEELDSLPGIGPSTAQKIIDYREQNGPFFVVEDLLNVSGIGETTLNNIRDLITTGY
ncbi:MAG: hypothetical protein Fur002_00170 [Anaerolineales bacterium]